MGVEPYDSIGSGIVELITSILILIPRSSLLGALLAIVTMLTAIFLHIFVLGIQVKDDRGTLLALATITLI